MAKRTTKPSAAAVAPARPELETEVANRLRDPFETNYMGVVRTNDPLLLERGDGARAFELYRDLKRDGKVFSGLQKRKLAVIAKPWQVEPIEEGPAGERDAKIVTQMLKRLNFDKLCDELLDALLVGFVPAEIVWTIWSNMVAPARVVKRAQRRFVYVQDDPNAAPALHLLTQSNMLKGEALPERKFLVHRVNPEDDNPYGTGLGLQLYWPVFFKRKGILSWNKLNDRFGSPTPWGKYPRNAGPKEKGTLFDALKALSNDGVMMTPDGMAIELLESKLTGSITTQQNLCEYMDDWIMEVILGQSPRGKGGGAMAAASNEREDVRAELSQADSDLLSETLNSTLLKWFCEFNGLVQCQVYRVIKKAEDLKAASETDKNVSEMGFKMTVAGVKAKYGEHWEAAPAPAPGAVAKPAGLASFAEPAPAAAQPDALDKLIDAELAQWRPVMEPMVNPIRKLLADAAARGQTAAELLARLPELLAEMDADPLADSLTRTAFAARLGADAGLENE
jgi:phage gp29-like protein